MTEPLVRALAVALDVALDEYDGMDGLGNEPGPGGASRLALHLSAHPALGPFLAVITAAQAWAAYPHHWPAITDYAALTAESKALLSSIENLMGGHGHFDDCTVYPSGLGECNCAPERARSMLAAIEAASAARALDVAAYHERELVAALERIAGSPP